MMRTPDGHSRPELSHFLAPPVVSDHRNAPVNALGYLRVMFAVDDIHACRSDQKPRLRHRASSSLAQHRDRPEPQPRHGRHLLRTARPRRTAIQPIGAGVAVRR
jgi:hypothetical protein